MSDLTPAQQKLTDSFYGALKAQNYEVYRKAINYASGISLNNYLSLRAAAEIERTLVFFACELLNIEPERYDSNE